MKKVTSDAKTAVANIKAPNITGKNTVKSININKRQLGLEFVDANGEVTVNQKKENANKNGTMCSVGINCENGEKIKKLINDQVTKANNDFNKIFENITIDIIKSNPTKWGPDIINASNNKALAMTKEINVETEKLVCEIHIQVSMRSSEAIQPKKGKIIRLDVKNRKIKVQVDGNTDVHEVLFSDLCIGSKGRDGIFSNVYDEKDNLTCNLNVSNQQSGGKKNKFKGKKSKNEDELSASNDICE
jgi:hypothetical protein